jgi:hypothetical protein
VDEDNRWPVPELVPGDLAAAESDAPAKRPSQRFRRLAHPVAVSWGADNLNPVRLGPTLDPLPLAARVSILSRLRRHPDITIRYARLRHSRSLEVELNDLSYLDGVKLELVWTPPGTYDYQTSS